MDRWEIAIAVRNKDQTRYRVGDIVEARKAIGEIGKKEGTHFLWLVGEVPDGTLLTWLTEGGPNMKRRYCIPFDNLKRHYHGLNETLAKDETTWYQPFLEGPQHPAPVQIMNLVYDKVLNTYL